jgi:hypothetical protein
MKILDKIKEVFSQYELKPLVLPEGHKDVYSFLRAYPEFKKDFETEKDDVYFIKKYRKHIPKGWYGFSIGSPIVPEWNEIIDNVLEICIKEDPDFEIHQIKIKFGGIRFYCGSQVIEDINEVERLIDTTLFDRALIF